MTKPATTANKKKREYLVRLIEGTTVYEISTFFTVFYVDLLFGIISPETYTNADRRTHSTHTNARARISVLRLTRLRVYVVVLSVHAF